MRNANKGDKVTFSVDRHYHILGLKNTSVSPEFYDDVHGFFSCIV